VVILKALSVSGRALDPCYAWVLPAHRTDSPAEAVVLVVRLRVSCVNMGGGVANRPPLGNGIFGVPQRAALQNENGHQIALTPASH
jgi:hypothetical protein